jgi:hypothetical protein
MSATGHIGATEVSWQHVLLESNTWCKSGTKRRKFAVPVIGSTQSRLTGRQVSAAVLAFVSMKLIGRLTG